MMTAFLPGRYHLDKREARAGLIAWHRRTGIRVGASWPEKWAIQASFCSELASQANEDVYARGWRAHGAAERAMRWHDRANRCADRAMRYPVTAPEVFA